MTGVSVVMPVLDGGHRLRRAIAAIRRETAGRPHEVLVVDDGSGDGAVERVAVERWSDVRIVGGPRRGAAAALNAGLREARFPFVAQVDQDVIVRRGWLAPLLEALDDPAVAAAQGRYVVPRSAGFWARVMGRDLELRYDALRDGGTDHVCTGNAVYRASALHQIGLFDETLGYGYDNDVSYRLRAAGYRLVFCPDAHADHYWRDSLAGYCAQQYGVGYGRLDLVRRHPRRVRGDAVSGTLMILHAPVMLLVFALAIGATAAAAAKAWSVAGPMLAASLALAGVLAAERSVAGVRSWRRARDAASLAFGAAHLLRDAVWAVAIVRWSMRRIAGERGRPSDSMPRTRSRSTPRVDSVWPADRAMLVLIPAHNEADSLPAVVADLRHECPSADILVIDDASTDATGRVLPTLGVGWLSLPQRLGVGGALRAGMRYAGRHGYEVVARIDGDGQHRARDLRRLAATVGAGRADAAHGSRYVRASGRRRPMPRLSQRALALCLSVVTGRRVTDPTSGLWVFGLRAVRLLGLEHPDGYPEPELRLLLHRHGLHVRELAIVARARRAGSTTLTPGRAAVAFARTLLAIVVVPLRRPAPGLTDD
ncbi:MAG TPA: glycosyltransferase [Dehalococcoidia bacterium]|nr:glycosyltransferase [Dehalococcoidia bacterium]